LGLFDTDVFVTEMILQVSKIGWVRVLFDDFAFAFLFSYPFLQISFSSHSSWRYLGSRVCRALDCLPMSGFCS
jgi:hypothetical protein